MKEKVRTEVIFEVRNGRTLSRTKEFFEDGTMASEGLFSSGAHWSWDIPAGMIKTYFKNGILKSEELFDVGGNREGDSKFYDDHGTLIARYTFSNDKKISEEFFDKKGEPVTSPVDQDAVRQKIA